MPTSLGCTWQRRKRRRIEVSAIDMVSSSSPQHAYLSKSRLRVCTLEQPPNSPMMAPLVHFGGTYTSIA
eukprot:2984143-Prymnesium_polylepis.1